MFNKHARGFLFHYLRGQGFPLEFVKDLLQASLQPALLHEAANCTWDPKTGELSTPSDEEDSRLAQELENQPFFRDVVGEMLAAADAKTAGGKSAYAAAGMLFNLDGEQSIKTVHGKNDKNYTKDTAPEVVDLSGGDEHKASAANQSGAPTHHSSRDPKDADRKGDSDSVGSSADDSSSGASASSASKSSDDASAADGSAGSG